MEIRKLDASDVDAVLTAAVLFDDPPERSTTERFLERDGHHMFFAWVDGVAAGFITGVEITHPDKGTEMMLYELGVDDPFRRRGIATALVEALRALAAELGCHEMWVPIEPDNDAAIATYRSTGAATPEPAAIQSWSLNGPFR